MPNRPLTAGKDRSGFAPVALNGGDQAVSSPHARRRPSDFSQSEVGAKCYCQSPSSLACLMAICKRRTAMGYSANEQSPCRRRWHSPQWPWPRWRGSPSSTERSMSAGVTFVNVTADIFLSLGLCRRKDHFTPVETGTAPAATEALISITCSGSSGSDLPEPDIRHKLCIR